MSQNVVIIPIYKNILSSSEKLSISQAAKILYKHDFKIICPENIDVEPLKEFFADVNYEFVFFDKKHFKSIQSYSNLMLDKNFYLRFAKYKYMLIYQTDAFVFSDELNYWAEKGFDYIGSPWFENYDKADNKSNFLEYSGNGGFSLRNIDAMVKTLRVYEKKFKHKKIKPLIHFIITAPKAYPHCIENILKYFQYSNTYEHHFIYYNEDFNISNYFRIINPNFRVAKASEAISFGFEVLPEKMYEINNHKLPFGCHGFQKYGYDFWEKFIKT